MATAKNTFSWEDPFHLSAQLTDDERQVQDAARAYCQEKLLPRGQRAVRNETTDASIFREMGELGLLRPTIPEQYGGPGWSAVQKFIFENECALAHAPRIVPFGVNMLGPVLIKYGAFIQSVIDFAIVAFVLFMVIKAMNNLKKPAPAAPAAPPAPAASEVYLKEIRDALVKK